MAIDPIDDDDGPSLPARLRADLSRLSPPVEIPPAVDFAVLARAKSDYARRVRFRPVFRWAAVAAAMAAVVTVVFVVRMTLVRPVQPVAIHTPTTKVPGDINGDGKVDMLDAFILAKRINAGGKLEPAWDINGDGAVDQRDIDSIANAAVSLGVGERQSGGAAR